MGERNDTSLIRLVITRLVEIHNWTYSQTLDKFYNSRVCKLLSNEDTGVFISSQSDRDAAFREWYDFMYGGWGG